MNILPFFPRSLPTGAFATVFVSGTVALTACAGEVPEYDPMLSLSDSALTEAEAACEAAFECGCDPRGMEDVDACIDDYASKHTEGWEEILVDDDWDVDEACVARRTEYRVAQIDALGCDSAWVEEFDEECVTGRLSLGEGCPGVGGCAPGLICDFRGTLTCIEHAPNSRDLGELCNFHDECDFAADVICLEGRCEPRPEQVVLEEGEACTHVCSGVLCDCGEGLACDGERCVTTGEMGDDCVVGTCGSDSRCDPDSNVCVELLTDGEICDYWAPERGCAGNCSYRGPGETGRCEPAATACSNLDYSASAFFRGGYGLQANSPDEVPR